MSLRCLGAALVLGLAPSAHARPLPLPSLAAMLAGEAAKLESVSFCRVAGGSGQRHEITAAGSELVESGIY